MRIMTRMGRAVFDVLGGSGVSCPACTRRPRWWWAKRDVDGRATRAKIHRAFPEAARSGAWLGHGGNALLGKKCFALRIAR
jgi:phosphoenolpyruvate carboxykinase (GTP)